MNTGVAVAVALCVGYFLEKKTSWKAWGQFLQVCGAAFIFVTTIEGVTHFKLDPRDIMMFPFAVYVLIFGAGGRWQATLERLSQGSAA